MDFDTRDSPEPTHRRQASSSSRGSIPPDTDHDFDLNDQDQTEDDVEQPRDQEEEDISPLVPKNAPKKISTQQLKYNQEQPEIRASRVLHGPKPGKSAPTLESAWHHTARLTFPSTGGLIRLLDQNLVLLQIIKAAITLSLYEIPFKCGYEPVISRAAFVRRLMRLCAKKDARGSHVERRAKEDTSFCKRLAPIICTRSSNFRTNLRTSALSKVATLYELNKPGAKAAEIRAIVKQLLQDQRYILPYAPSAVSRPVVAQDGESTADLTSPGPPKAFIVAQPFHAPAIVDLIHEGWWSSSKSLGFTYIKDLKSNRDDRPNEVVLPDPMICLAGSFVWAALQTYSTGRFVPAPEFSQARLEGTYKSLLAVLTAQREGKSAKTFNRTMHELYVKVSHSQIATASAASGSANNIICLDIDSE
ncbi:hypothetical protein B0H16DRAFT_1500378 [Mycena metata]|uniref:DUF6532 domain-containing protein n=1 Tax=Mycena metata TaxID=1033252 RepID=A0AAD7K7M5_9AGAR|nr:hypothetical protein B0H16DRAFT_1572679 [Mycena metata]KAJ7780010.1 hypothetical protein B0H16DRAFT_1500378 [Mycena metata]